MVAGAMNTAGQAAEEEVTPPYAWCCTWFDPEDGYKQKTAWVLDPPLTKDDVTEQNAVYVGVTGLTCEAHALRAIEYARQDVAAGRATVSFEP